MKTIAILITLLLIININIYQGNSTEVLPLKVTKAVSFNIRI